ncbi:MAG: glycoside hydrolase family 9 protein [Bacteroidales bacterium]|nr:glycoside hydrolase family 9 protein [Bacteroidales bacterium]
MMKKLCILGVLITGLFIQTMAGNDQEDRILLPQNGFVAGLNKIAMVRAPADSFCIITADNNIVFRGKLQGPAFWSYSGDWVQKADFSALKAPGEYYFALPGTKEQRRFRIHDDPYGDIANAAVKAFYYNRCSYPILPAYGGVFQREAGHPDREVYVHQSAASEKRPEGTVLSSPGGWYDAGDYNKYIVNSGITTYTMLLALEYFPTYWKSRNLAIPESGNNLPDLLDETLFNLRWMLTMQDSDGGVYHKLTTLNFEPFVMPADAHDKRYVIQKNTAASLDFAATMAHASGILADFSTELPGLADSCRKAAVAAWNWCKKNPGILYRQPPDISTGAYGDGDIRDEWFWAGVEMTVLTGSAFPDSLLNKLQFQTPSWGSVATLGLITALTNSGKIKPELYTRCQTVFYTYVDQLINLADKSAWPVSLDYWAWGSNSDIANQGLLKMVAYAFRNDVKYLHSALNDMNYLAGVNPTGYCFITGFGEKSPMNIHHRVSGSDKISDPVPGFLAGGPNTVVFSDCPDIRRSLLPALSYVDELCSYSTNEIAINWNAPLVFLAGAISCAAGQLQSTK